MENQKQRPNQQVGDDSTQTQHEPSRRGQTEIQGEDVATTGSHRDRQPQQSKVPDAELNGD